MNRQREKKVYENLKKIEQTTKAKRIGILYGAAHMPVIEQRLIQEGYTRNNKKPKEYIKFNLSIQEALKEIHNKI